MSPIMSRTLISLVQELSQLDATIARANADKKKLEGEIATRKEVLTKIHREASAKIKLFEERKSIYAKEEKFLKEERDKIADRRRGLGSHNNYKVQQAAEKELDYVARQINLKEDNLIKGLTEVEELEKESKAWREKFDASKLEYEAIQKEALETFPVIEERVQRAAATRQQLVQPIEPARLTLYERARSKFPTDPMVEVNAQFCCGGCFMNVGPQVVVQIHKGDSLVKCPGCNRILYLSGDLEVASQNS